MRFSIFLRFVAPSILSMLVLIFLPLLGVSWLAVHKQKTKTEQIETTIETPLFGGLTQKKTEVTTQAVLDENGQPIISHDFVGTQNFIDVLRTDEMSLAWEKTLAPNLSFFKRLQTLYVELTKVEFWGALEFTLVYTILSLPFILGLGFLLAWLINGFTIRARGALVSLSLLPFIITPVVGSLAVYWLFLDDAIISAVLLELGFGKFYFLNSKWVIRSLIIVYGIWHSTPFAFVVLFAGLQSVPQDNLEAAKIDGAGMLQQIRYVVIPHLMPLFVFIALIHVMDAYRVFEPILVFGSALYADSLQHLTYSIIDYESNYNKAAASAILTVIGICILLIPALHRTWKEQKQI